MATRVEDRVVTRPVSVKSGGMVGLGRLVGSEMRLMRREPGILWVITLPILLCVVFGLIPATSTPDKDLGGIRFIDAYVPVLVCFLIAMMSLNVLASALGTYRERGVLRRFAVTPVKPLTVLLAQGLVSL
ncbi:ABC transporter permease, partial [Kibdelosporangium lantanae]